MKPRPVVHVPKDWEPPPDSPTPEPDPGAPLFGCVNKPSAWAKYWARRWRKPDAGEAK